MIFIHTESRKLRKVTKESFKLLIKLDEGMLNLESKQLMQRVVLDTNYGSLRAFSPCMGKMSEICFALEMATEQKT